MCSYVVCPHHCERRSLTYPVAVLQWVIMRGQPPVSGSGSTLRGIAIYAPYQRGARCTAVGPASYSSGIDECQVLHRSAFSYVYTLISCALSTQGQGMVGLLLLLSLQRGRVCSIYRAACTAGYPSFSERRLVGGRVSILRGIVIYPSPRTRRRLDSS